MARIIRHLIVILTLLCFLAIFASALAGIDPTVTPEPAAAPTETVPSPTPTSVPPTPASNTVQPTGTPEPKEIRQLREFMVFSFGAVQRASNMVETLWPLLLGLLVIGLVTILVVRTLNETQRYRIELDKLQNGTSDAAFNDQLTGIDGLVREKLIRKLKGLQETIRKYSSYTSEGAVFPTMPLPQDSSLTGVLNKVVDDLGDESPKYVKPLLSLWQYLVPAHGVRIRMTLQADENPAQPFGITSDLLDLHSQKTRRVYTIRERNRVESKLQPWLLCKPLDPATKPAEPMKRSAAAPASTAHPLHWTRLVATALESAGLYEDAITYYEMTLIESKEDTGAAGALVECQAKLAKQAGPAKAFAIAARLEESGLTEAATESYAEIFPSHKEITSDMDAESALKDWQIVLGPVGGARGDALHRLATAYRIQMNLYEEAVGLYKRAVKDGNSESAKTLETIQGQHAEALVQASDWLMQNAQWSAADTYLTQALASAPDHRSALQLQERLKVSQPSQENKEALANFELGNVYWSRGRKKSAEEYFVKALEKQPDYKEAKQALTNALEKTVSTRLRFEMLLDRALDWLTIELFRQETDRMIGNQEMYWYKKAQYHNFYGAYLLSCYWKIPRAAELAEEDFLQAIEYAREWLQPYEHLGDLYGLQALNESDEATARHLLKKSMAWYDLALSKRDLHPNGFLTEITPAITMRIRLDRLISELLSCPEDPAPLWPTVQQVEQDLRQGEKRHAKIPVVKSFEGAYFSLAMLYALVGYRKEKTSDECGCPHAGQAKSLACFYLACSVFLDENRMVEASYNPVLDWLLPRKERQRLLGEIELKQTPNQVSRSKIAFYWEDVLDVLKVLSFQIPESLKEE